MHIVKGDATNPVKQGNKVIFHICNDRGKWGAGFVLAVSNRWPGVGKEYYHWHSGRSNLGKPFQLGEVQFVEVEDDLWVANMIAQTLGWSHDGVVSPPIRYNALKNCLNQVRQFCIMADASAHAPKIGSGLAGGDWNKIEQIITECMTGVDITIYEFE